MAFLSSKSSARIGVASLLVFLGLGMLAGSDGIGGIKFDDVELAGDFGVVSLAFILFSGGLGTRFRDIRPVLAPGLALASAGVAITAALLGWVATTVLRLPIDEGLALGAVIASTDAAAVDAILRSRGVRINGRLSSLLELESGSNDPAAVFLTVSLVTIVNGHDTNLLMVAGSFVVQMGVGAVCGYVLARVAVWGINRLRLDYEGLYPVLTFGFVLLTLAGTTLVGGSGFLAAYVAGVTMAHHDYLHQRSLTRFHDAIAWLVQIAMFVLLGLLVFPNRLAAVAGPALAIAAVLMFVARPLAVAVTLAPFRMPVRDVAFVSWVGLRGATPIILATFLVAEALPDAERLFDVVFFVVLTSVLVQGASIPVVARWLRVTEEAGARARPTTFDAVTTGDDGPRLHEVVIESDSRLVGRTIVDLALPHGVLVVLVRRGPETFHTRGRHRRPRKRRPPGRRRARTRRTSRPALRMTAPADRASGWPTR